MDDCVVRTGSRRSLYRVELDLDKGSFEYGNATRGLEANDNSDNNVLVDVVGGIGNGLV
jgi:hypothetical protein